MSSSTYLPLRFAFIFSLSLAGAAATFTKTRFNIVNIDALSPPSKPKATVSDLLSLLSTPQKCHSVNSQVAQDIWSCFKFLAPFPPYNETLSTRRSLSSKTIFSSNRSEEDIDYLILSPPEPVLELARLAVDSGADPGAIQRALDPTILPVNLAIEAFHMRYSRCLKEYITTEISGRTSMLLGNLQVPDVEGSNEDRCELTRTPYGRHFINEELNSYIEFLFKIIVERGPRVGLNVSLSRYDLFHGHLFLAADSGRLGILFHAREYPAYDKEVFPFNMGYCQFGSHVAYDDSMNLRNILWLAPLPSNSTKAWLAPGVLVVLDAHPEGIIYQDLIPDYVQIARTLYEDDFGEVVVDVNYLNVGTDVPKFQVFLC